ncbi:MAG TPA: RraA family protein [Shinella sp.]|uniref:RraA family protein n=1 Tax=Shinella sp. TaxID=1870904 RepID=UPI0029B150F0|nr:RraA family protein [Shinella sp.]MDX3978473.1 RraA family protein [Shinella sp.]HEV7245477.1 RraA family protein [Shinella sp.]
MSQPVRNPLPAPVSPDVIEAFRVLATANISDNLDRQPGAIGLRPFHDGTPMAGTAFTVRTRAGDNKVIHEALDLVRPGDVLVVDGDGDMSRALIGEIMCAIAKKRGVAGFVLDGAIRDVDAIARAPFPVFARTVIHRGPYKNGPGEINAPVAVGGMVVRPGDIVVGDGDGVVAFDPAMAIDLLAAVRAQERKEAEILRTIEEGTYTGAYAGKN